MILKAEQQTHETFSELDPSIPAEIERDNEVAQSKETRELLPEEIERAATIIHSLDQAHQEVGKLMVSGQQDVAAIDHAVGMTPDQAASMHEETGILRQLHALHDKIRETLLTIVHFASKTVQRPIAHGEVFDSSVALGEIHAAPRKERKQLILELKDKLAYQQVGLGKMREDMWDLLQHQGAVNLEKMRGIADEYSAKYGFDEFTRDMIDDTLEKVDERSLVLDKAAEKYPTGESFFRAMVQGQAPVGEVEIIYTPITAFLRCHNVRDYAALYYGGKRTPDSMNDHELSVAGLSRGCALYNAPIPGLEDAVSVENVSGDDKVVSKKTLIHEEQHILHRMIPEFEESHLDYMNRNKKYEEMDDSEFRTVIRRNVRSRRTENEARAKDEIMAYLKDGRPSDDIYQTLLKPEEEGGLYDYFNTVVGNMHIILSEGKLFPKDRTPIVEEIIQDVFKTEYAQLLDDALRAVDTLRFKNGMSVEQVLGMLAHEPLRTWPKVVGRIHKEESWRVLISEVDDMQQYVGRLKRRWDVLRGN